VQIKSFFSVRTYSTLMLWFLMLLGDQMV